MAHFECVYGIIDAGEWRKPFFDTVLAFNQKVLEDFSLESPYSPLLNKSMFCFTDPEQSYPRQIIHFAGVENYLTSKWNDWIYEFEQLLHELCWIGAVVHLESDFVGNQRYAWTIGEASLKKVSGGPLGIEEWSFEGGPREFDL